MKKQPTPRNDEVSRDRLLDAGKAEFLAKGFRKARLVDIVRAAGVTTGPVYWHFRDKEGLFGVLVSDAYDRAVAMFEKAAGRYHAFPEDAREAYWETDSITFVTDLAILVFERKDEFLLLTDGRAVGTKWDGLARTLADREVHEVTTERLDALEKNAPGGGIPRETLVDLLHGLYGALFKGALRAATREEAIVVAERLVAFYSAGYFALFGLVPGGSRNR